MARLPDAATAVSLNPDEAEDRGERQPEDALDDDAQRLFDVRAKGAQKVSPDRAVDHAVIA